MTKANEVEEALHSIPWLDQLDQFSLDRLQTISRIIQLDGDKILFNEGDKEDYLYILLVGRIALEMDVPRRGKTLIFTAEPFDIIGWSSATPIIRQRTAAARTLTPAHLLAFDSSKLRQLCDEDNKIGYVIMRRLANIIATRLLVTRLQLVELLSNIPQP